MENITYQSDRLWVKVNLSNKEAFVRRRNAIGDEWSDWEKRELEEESRMFFESLEKDLDDYLGMFDGRPFSCSQEESKDSCI